MIGFVRKWCAKRLLDRAERFLEAGSLEQAADCAREALSMDSVSRPALMVLGMAQFRMEQFSDAAETFEAALEADPGNEVAKVHMAMACARSAKWDKAAAAVDDLARREKGAARSDAAAGTRQQSEPDAAAPRPHARSVAEMIREGDWQGLCEVSEAALRKNPSNPNALMQLGMALYRLGQTERSLETYDKALACVKSEQDKAVVAFNRATVLMQVGRWEQSCRSFESLAGLPDDIRGKIRLENVLYNLAFCYRKRQMIRMALATYERLDDLSPNYRDVDRCLRSLRVPLAARAAVPDDETGTVRCGGCNRNLPLGATFCNGCGWSASSEEHAAVRLES